MEERTFLEQLPFEKRVVVKQQIRAQMELFKKEKELLMKNLIAPIDERIELAKKVLGEPMYRSEPVSLQYYIKRGEKLSKHVQAFFEYSATVIK